MKKADNVPLPASERQALALEVGRVFTPAAPIDQKDLFAGRNEQLRRVVDAISQRGQHAVIFGERGVGKTSLANVLAEFLRTRGQVVAPHVNCDGGDTFTSLWRKVFAEINLVRETRNLGLRGGSQQELTRVSDTLAGDLTPDDVRRQLTHLGQQVLLIVILDEYDRLPNGALNRTLADTIKTLSDHSVPATLVLVGVADSVDELIGEHRSVERALVQVQMPRMSIAELHQIVTNGLSHLGAEVESEALDQIGALSQGLPHYTHLLGLYATRQAIDRGSLRLSVADVKAAVSEAIKNAQQSIVSAYHKATMSARQGSLYSQVLLACALASHDSLGYFQAADVRGPMSHIKGKIYDIPTYARHLNDFCEQSRGPVLQKTGVKHRFRFRFVNPLMEPFVIMQGLDDGLINWKDLER